jgi:hypothetical protein
LRSPLKKSRVEYLFVLAISIINVVASNTTDYFPDNTLNPGIIRAFVIGIFALYFIIKKYPFNSINRFILFYIIYHAILVVLSSDFFFSASLYMKFLLGVIMFPIGYYYINNEERFKTLISILLIALVLQILNIIISNIFELGTSDYLEDSFYFGPARVNITKSIIALVFLVPLALYYFRTNRTIIAIIYLIGFIVAMIGIKRAVLLSGLGGLVVYLILKKQKSNIIKGGLGVGIFLLISLTIFPKYFNIFLSRYEARGDQMQINTEIINEESRYDETIRVIETWINGSVKHKLIGSELFNDRKFFKSHRMLHTDYMIILNGSGAIGIFLWFFMFWLIIKEKNKYYKYLRNRLLYQEVNSVFYMFLIAQLILSVSGTVYNIEVRSIFFLYWGAMIGTMRSSAVHVFQQSYQ